MPDQVVETMRRSSLLQNSAHQLVEELAGYGRVRSFRRGTYLFHRGDEAGEVYFLLEGRVEMTSTTSSGQERLHAVIDPGEFLGEFEVLGESARSATAAADEECKVWIVDGEVFLRFLANHPEINRTLLRILARQLQARDDLIEDLIGLDLRGRVAKWLLTLSDAEGAARPRRSESVVAMAIPTGTPTSAVTQKDIADMSGASRENVARVLSEFQRRGLVERSGQRYVLKNPDHLRRLAGVESP